MRAIAIGSVIRLMRIASGLRQCDMARDVRVSSTLISRIENGHVVPSMETLMGILEVLTRSTDRSTEREAKRE
jgi:transcriptional regulator with XRE-family HTH domain